MKNSAAASAVRTALRRFGLAGFNRRDISLFLSVHDIDLVIDVGANAGQFASELRERGFKNGIWSFEPVRSVYSELEAACKGDSLWSAFQLALGREQGEIEINVSTYSQYSSIKRLSTFASGFDRRTASLRTERVPVDTLDNVLEDNLARSVFLKIDTQGFEKEVLDGSARSLQRIGGVLLELPIEHLYEDVWDFHEGVGYMAEHGFVPAQIHAVNPLADDPASAIEFDVLFRRRSSRRPR